MVKVMSIAYLVPGAVSPSQWDLVYQSSNRTGQYEVTHAQDAL